MEKENKRYGPKEYTYNLENYHLYEKKNMKSNAFPSPQGEKGDCLQNYSEKAILYKINK